MQRILKQKSVLSKIIREYPFLTDYNPRIIKQFKSIEGRIYNTFLVKSDKKGFKKFVAKSGKTGNIELGLEWEVLKLLQKRNVQAPKLLLPKHKPNDFILMNFIGKYNASDVLKRGEKPNAVFRKIGTAAGKIHSVHVSNFGELLHPGSDSWETHIQQKFDERVRGVQYLVASQLIDQTKEMYKEYSKFILKDGRSFPILIHRDIYSENFIIEESTGKAVLIDFGMARGGRPLFDLAKLYIWDLYQYPKSQNAFLQTYTRYVPWQKSYKSLLKFYILLELIGMIASFHSRKNPKLKLHAVKVLKEILRNRGKIIELLDNMV